MLVLAGLACRHWVHTGAMVAWLTLAALQVRLLHEVRDAGCHLVNAVDGLDAALDDSVLATHHRQQSVPPSLAERKTHLGFSCFTGLAPFLPCFRSCFCSVTAPTLAIDANSFRSASAAS